MAARVLRTSDPTHRLAHVEQCKPAVGLSKSRRRGTFPRPTRKPRFSSEIPRRLLKHVFRVENSYLSCESVSTESRPLKLLENAPHQITECCRRPVGLLEIANRFVKQDFRAENSCLFRESHSVG